MQFAIMRSVGFLLVALCLVQPTSTTFLSSKDSQISAVLKVVHMLEDMAAKAKKEKNDEEISYAAFSTWCANEQETLKKQITKSTKEIETLSADLGKLETDITTLGDAIATLHTDLAQYAADLKSNAAQRKADHKSFLTEQQDYSESIDALERAIAVLQKQSYDRTSLLQMSEIQQLPANAQQMVAAFVGMLDDDKEASKAPDYTAPEANAYEFQSGSIVELLKRLKTEFVDKQAQCEKEEMNSKHAHEMLVQELTDSQENAESDISSKTALKQEKHESSAFVKKQLTSTTAVKESDSTSLVETTTECNEKKLSYDEKQELRAEEIQALAKAIEILSSDEVQQNAEKYLGLAQLRKSATSLLQVDGSENEGTVNAGIRRRLREFIASEGKRLHSQQLGLLAQRLATSEDPFAKVKKMIQALLTRLLEEANQDAEHEGFCDKELGTSKITREKLSVAIDELTAQVENGKATIGGLTEDLATLALEVAEIDTAVKQATEMRTNEKEKNEVTIADAKDAQRAVQAAMEVLKDFYSKASSATAFLEESHHSAPRASLLRRGVKMGSEEWNSLANPNFEGTVDKGHKEGMQTFGANYKGKQQEAGGVLAMLEVISSDFASLQADTESDESLSQQEYDSFMNESRKNRAVKSKKVQLNTSDKLFAESKLRQDIADLKFTQDKLLAADRYYEKLVPQCMDKGMTFGERTKARAEEIRSLKEALRILEGQDIATTA